MAGSSRLLGEFPYLDYTGFHGLLNRKRVLKVKNSPATQEQECRGKGEGGLLCFA